jgi:hypothetical protein
MESPLSPNAFQPRAPSAANTPAASSARAAAAACAASSSLCAPVRASLLLPSPPSPPLLLLLLLLLLPALLAPPPPLTLLPLLLLVSVRSLALAAELAACGESSSNKRGLLRLPLKPLPAAAAASRAPTDKECGGGMAAASGARLAGGLASTCSK